jgi:hypothetical protein
LKAKSQKAGGLRPCWFIEALRLFVLWIVTGDRRHLHAGLAHLAGIINRITSLLP